jgi:hypothetical protein
MSRQFYSSRGKPIRAFRHSGPYLMQGHTNGDWRIAMNVLAATTALAASLVLTALLYADGAQAQKYRAAPKPYAAPNSYDSIHELPRDPRFTDQEQRIIDRITRADERNGK